MNTKILLLAISVAALTSCSTAYKMGQTPDDVYYSPAKIRAEGQQQDDYVSGGNQPQRYTGAQRQNNGYDSYEDFDSYRNDRFLRMSIGSNMRMGAFNDYYMYDGYSNWKYNNYAYNFNTPWNSYYYWNSYYNPYNSFNFYNPYYGGGYYGGYGGGGIIIDKSNTAGSVSRPRAFAPSSYTNNTYSNSNLYLYRNGTTTTGTSRPGVYMGGRYNNINSGSNSTMRRLPATGNTYYNTNSSNNRSLNNGNSNNNSYNTPRNNNTYEAPTRSYTPSSTPSSSGSSSGGSGGGGGGVSRPSRGN